MRLCTIDKACLVLFLSLLCIACEERSEPKLNQPVELQPYSLVGGFDLIPLPPMKPGETKRVTVAPKNSNYYMIALELTPSDGKASEAEFRALIENIRGSSVEVRVANSSESTTYLQTFDLVQGPLTHTTGLKRGGSVFWIAADLSLCSRVPLDKTTELNVTLNMRSSSDMNRFGVKPILAGPTGKNLNIYGDPRASYQKEAMKICEDRRRKT